MSEIEILSKDAVAMLRLAYDFVPHSGFHDRANGKDVRALIRTNVALHDALVKVERARLSDAEEDCKCEWGDLGHSICDQCRKSNAAADAAVADLKKEGWVSDV